MMDFKNIYNNLKGLVGEISISKFVDANSFACAIITANNNVYYGTNFQAGCGLSSCAEKTAIGNAIMKNDCQIKYIMCIFKDHSFQSPCGACRELIAEVNENNFNAEIIYSINPLKTKKLSELLPDWWGKIKQ